MSFQSIFYLPLLSHVGLDRPLPRAFGWGRLVRSAHSLASSETWARLLALATNFGDHRISSMILISLHITALLASDLFKVFYRTTCRGYPYVEHLRRASNLMSVLKLRKYVYPSEDISASSLPPFVLSCRFLLWTTRLVRCQSCAHLATHRLRVLWRRGVDKAQKRAKFSKLKQECRYFHSRRSNPLILRSHFLPSLRHTTFQDAPTPFCRTSLFVVVLT